MKTLKLYLITVISGLSVLINSAPKPEKTGCSMQIVSRQASAGFLQYADCFPTAPAGFLQYADRFPTGVGRLSAICRSFPDGVGRLSAICRSFPDRRREVFCNMQKSKNLIFTCLGDILQYSIWKILPIVSIKAVYLSQKSDYNKLKTI